MGSRRRQAFYQWFGVESEPPALPPSPQDNPLVKVLCTALAVPVPGPGQVVKHTESKKRLSPPSSPTGAGERTPPMKSAPTGASSPTSSSVAAAHATEVEALQGQISALQAALIKSQEVALDAVNRLASYQADELTRVRGLEMGNTPVSPGSVGGGAVSVERVRLTPKLDSETVASARRLTPLVSSASLSTAAVSNGSEQLRIEARALSARATRAALVEKIAEQEAARHQTWDNQPFEPPTSPRSPAQSSEFISGSRSRGPRLPFFGKPAGGGGRGA